MIAEIAGLFGSRLAPRRSRASVRRRRPAGGRIAIESLEPRQVLNGDTGWIKIDLSQLDQTGVTPAYDIYIQGSANKSGQILQYDPSLATPDGTGGLVFTTPLPSPVTFTSANYTPVSGDSKSITLSTAAEIFAGGSVKFSGGATSTIASITANVTVGSWTPPASAGPGGTWNPFPSSQVTGNPNVVIQSGSFSGSGTLDGTTLTGANGPAVSISGMSIGSLVVGTIPGVSPNPNTYFFPNSDGQPFHTAKGPAQVTQVGPNSQSSGDVDVTFSETSSQSTALGSDFLTVFSGGTNSGFATYVGAASQTTPIPTSLGGGAVQEVTVGNLLSTGQVKPTDVSGFNPDSTAAQGNQPQPQSFLVVDGFAETFPIYGIESYTITFAEAVPANTSSITFETTVAATATSATTFTIDAGSGGIPGIIAGLSLGLQPTLSQADQATRALSITALAIDYSNNIITVTLSGTMPWSTGAMKVDLPPTGGFLPTTKWSATDSKSNTIWARQTSAGSTSDPKISVNGSRIYFSLVKSGDEAPQMPYAQGSAGLSVTQFKPEDIWNGTVPLSQYLELTADALSGAPGNGDGAVYLDLSAVDGFFFPAALSTTVNGHELVLGQASGTYVSPPTATVQTTYSAVSREEIVDAYDTFFTNTTNTSRFATGASTLQQAYAGLHVMSNGTSIGIQNPTFIDWSTPFSSAATVLNAAWDNDLDALFTTASNQVNLLGDKNSTAWSVVNAIQVGSQGSSYAVGDVITFTAPSSGGRAATAKVTQVQPSTATNPGGIVQVVITDSGVYPSSETPTVQSISGSGGGATLNVVAMVPAATFYKGVPKAAAGTASGSNPSTLVLTEYVGPSVIAAGQFAPPANFAYANLYATGAVFTVFDPRTVPASETQAFNPGANGGKPTPMAVGQQIVGNFGVFASTTLNTTGPNPNYAFTGTDPWSPGDALAQLESLQRDIVWALNQGNGGLPAALASTTPGSTTAYWTNEENWYPYPSISPGGKYQAQTPQNLFAQWVHTAGSAGGPALGKDKYFASFPFGNVNPTQQNPSADYGQPTKAWGPGGAGTGPLMNQTYGFAYDEAPAHGIAGANVPSKFLAIPNTAGQTLTFQLVFGPWADPAPTVDSITTSPAQSGSTPTPATSKTLSWTVTFSEAVSGVTASNFTSLTDNTDASGSVTLSSLTVSPMGGALAKAWTVTGTILGVGAGKTTLNLSNNTGITDSSGQKLSISTYGGETYAYVAPAVTGLSQAKGSVNGGTVVTISGTGFNNTSTVKFGTFAATNVKYTPASGGTPATLTAVSPAQAAGTVDITVTTGDLTSATSPADAFTYVATSRPVVLSSASPLPADATTFTIVGEHFSPTKAGNTVTLSSGTAIVQSATATSITLLFTSQPTAGPLTATVKTGGVSSGAVQVARVFATVTPGTAPLAATAKTLVISGVGFNAKTPANNIVTLSSGGGVVTKATATALTISLTSPPQPGPLSVTSISVGGVQSAPLVQVATVVPGPASARSTVTASVAEAAVGTAVTVSLQAVDSVGNLVTTGGARVRFASSSSGTFSKVTDNGDGTYTATFTTKRVGAQVFSATVNGANVTDTATTAFVFTSQFSQPIPNPNWSVARGGFLTLLNTAFATATRNNVALYTGVAARNVTVSANVENLENGQFGGVVARYSSRTSYYQAGLLLESGQYYAVIQAVGLTGVRTLVKQSVVGPGEGLVSFTLSGTSLSLSLNGFQVAQVTDSRFQSGSVGISGGRSVGFTNFFAG